MSELLAVENLQKYFPVTRGLIFQKEIAQVKAVDGVNFTLEQGETLGVVGESGCGKSTMARCIARLLEPTGGKIIFEGRDITHLNRSDMRAVRRDMMMVFQDPYASLNARKRVGSIVGEPLEVRHAGTHCDYVVTQLKGSLAKIPADAVASMVIAYEPVWAIGTGEVASPDDALEMAAAIREHISGAVEGEAGAWVHILYGGYVKGDNIAPIMAGQDVDGALVGGASLDAGQFAAICRYRELATGR